MPYYYYNPRWYNPQARNRIRTMSQDRYNQPICSRNSELANSRRCKVWACPKKTCQDYYDNRLEGPPRGETQSRYRDGMIPMRYRTYTNPQLIKSEVKTSQQFEQSLDSFHEKMKLKKNPQRITDLPHLDTQVKIYTTIEKFNMAMLSIERNENKVLAHYKNDILEIFNMDSDNEWKTIWHRYPIKANILHDDYITHVYEWP